jgi:UDP-glucose 4-epimerase
MVKLSNSKVLVTGNNGFIGTFLVKSLREIGAQVEGVDLKSGFDITDWGQIEKLEKAEIVYHLAAVMYIPFALKNPRIVYKVNVGGTLNILEYCRINDISKLVFASSYVYGQPEYLPVDESHPVKPTNPYARSKVMGEELCRGYSEDHGLNCVILRPFNVYGPGQNKNFLIPSIFDRIQNVKKIKLKDPKPKRDFVYVTDMIDAYIKAGELPNTILEIFNIGYGKSYNVQEIVDEILQLTDKKVEVEYENERRPNEIMDTVAKIDKAKQRLGWSPKIDLENGLKFILKGNSS